MTTRINYTFMKGLSLGFGGGALLLFCLSFGTNEHKHNLRKGALAFSLVFICTAMALKAYTIKNVDDYKLKNEPSTFDEKDEEMVKYIKNVYWVEVLSIISIVFLLIIASTIIKK